MLQITKQILNITFKALVALATLTLLLLAALFRGVRYAQGLHRSELAARKGIFCPAGHRLIDYGTWECGACSMTWTGSGWYCPARECPAPATAHLHCQEQHCPYTIENPHRF